MQPLQLGLATLDALALLTQLGGVLVELGLALLEQGGIDVSASVMQYTRIKLKDGAGRGLDLSSDRVTRLPGFLAGGIGFRSLKDRRLAYSFLIRQDFNVGVSDDGPLRRSRSATAASRARRRRSWPTRPERSSARCWEHRR